MTFQMLQVKVPMQQKSLNGTIIVGLRRISKKNEAVQHYIRDYSFVQRCKPIRDDEQKTVPIRID